MALRLVALDPGGHTGWATFTDTGQEKEWNCGTLEPDGDGPGLGHHQQLFQMLEMFHTDRFYVISESFEYRNQSRAGLVLVSLEYIGVAKLFCRERGVPYCLQTASTGKVDRTGKRGFVKPKNLERLGLWSSHYEDRHAMDAYGHLLYWMINIGKIEHHQLLEKGWRA